MPDVCKGLKKSPLTLKIIRITPKSQLFTNSVKRKLVCITEYFLSKCVLILLPAVHSKNIKVTGMSPAQIIGFQKSPPPINASPKSNIGKSEKTKTVNEKTVPKGSPTNSAVRAPILSRFTVIIFVVLNSPLTCCS